MTTQDAIPNLSNRSPLRRTLNPSLVKLACLKPLGRATRQHSREQIAKLARSIEAFGFVLPIVIDANRRIIAGAALCDAAKHLELSEIPAVVIDDLSEAERRALRLALNRLSEDASWNKAELTLELEAIIEIDQNFAIDLTGFAMPEIDAMLAEKHGDDAADLVPHTPANAVAITDPGDLWLIGPHRLYCGDATSADAFASLMQGEQASMVFTDPPYNVPIDRHVCGLGTVQHAEFAFASGEMSEDEFIAFLKSVCANLGRFSTDGSLHFICMDWRHIYELLVAGRAHYSELKNLCVWNKTNGGMGSLYRSKHELVALFKSGTAPHVNNVELGRHGRYRTNVWDYAGINSFGSERDAQLAMHPTVKPVALVEDAILDCSKRNDIVLDAFCGSGTTLLAADRANRRCFAIEYEPLYVDVALRRMRDLTGIDPVLAKCGLKLSDFE